MQLDNGDANQRDDHVIILDDEEEYVIQFEDLLVPNLFNSINKMLIRFSNERLQKSRSSISKKLAEMPQETIEDFARGLEARIDAQRQIAQENSKLGFEELSKKLAILNADFIMGQGEEKERKRWDHKRQTLNLLLHFAQGKGKGRTWVEYDEQLETWEDMAPEGFPTTSKALKKVLNEMASLFADGIPIVYCRQGLSRLSGLSPLALSYP